jgi:DNA-binding response OmpR family regulator
VAFVRWPSEADERARLTEAGVPRLLLVEPGAAPPDTWDVDEDWIRIPADPIDLHQRAEVLRRRCAPAPEVRIDDDGLLWRGEAWTALAPVELALVEALLDRMGQLVRRRVLERMGWPTELPPDSRVLDRAISRVRAKVRPLGLEIRRIPGAGYLMEAARTGAH